MKTLFEKLFYAHVITRIDSKTVLLGIDRHVGHEVTSPIAFDDMQLKGLTPAYPERTFMVADHNTPTIGGIEALTDKYSILQLDALHKNTAKYDITCFNMGHPKNGVIHAVVPEQGIALPGFSLVCGDSHTGTYGGIGALSFGIGTSEVQIVLERQCLEQKIPKTMRITINGKLNEGVGPKDVILYVIGEIGTAGGTGYAVEFAGEVFRNMNVAGRLTVCNMGIEGGAKIAIIAVDNKTIEYCKKTPGFKKSKYQKEMLEYWETLHTDEGAVFDKELELNAAIIKPQVTWGTNPGQVVNVNGYVPLISSNASEAEIKDTQKALAYMGIKEGVLLSDLKVDYGFIGSCTNGRIEDLREAAEYLKGKYKAHNVMQVLVVPATMEIKLQAEEEGLDKIFIEAGCEWRNPGCSACLAMNPDVIPPGKRCISTSNRNFEGRQGSGARTHLASPLTVARSIFRGYISSV